MNRAFPRKASLLLLLVAFLVVVACAEATQVPTATPVATPVSTPTPVATAVSTPTPVATAVPTATPVPATAVPLAATAPPSNPPVPPASVEPTTVKRTEPCPTPQEWDYIERVNSYINGLASASRVLKNRTAKLEEVDEWDFSTYQIGLDVRTYGQYLDVIPDTEAPPSAQHIQVAMEQFADQLRAPIDAFEQAVANESPSEITEALEQEQAVLSMGVVRVQDLIRNFCPDDVERTEPCLNDLESQYIVIVTSHMNPLRAAAGHVRGRAERSLVLEWDFSTYRVESEVLSYRQNIDVVAGIEPPPSMQHIQDVFVQFADQLRVAVDAFEQAVVNESPSEVAEALEQEQAVWDTEDQVFDQFRNFCP